MLIYGHRFIKSENFYHIQSIETIENTPPSSTIYVEFEEQNLDIIEYLNNNNITFALHVKNITQIIYASALHSSFIVVDLDLAKTAQELANNYLFDAKILVHISNEKEIEEIALLGVDGVVFTSSIIKLH